MVVKRDLDELYRRLLHRKYSLSRTRAIISEWLEDRTLTEDTFLHFLGAAGKAGSDHTTERFEEFMEERFGELAPLYRHIERDQLAKAVLASLWAGPYGIEDRVVLEPLPFFQGLTGAERSEWMNHLTSVAQTLREHDAELLEALAARAEQDSAFVGSLWAALARFSPREIFGMETLFPAIVKEAFERLLSEPDAAPEAEVPAEGESPVHGMSRVGEQKRHMNEALALRRALNSTLGSSAPPSRIDPGSFAPWETGFISGVSTLPFLEASFRQCLKRVGMGPQPFLRQEQRACADAIRVFGERFGDFYRGALPLWEESGSVRPTMIEDIPSLASRLRKVPAHDQVRYLLMDGMRWDLWVRIREEFFGAHPDLFRVVREGSLWSNRPTVTQPQLARFETAFRTRFPDTPVEEMLVKASEIDEKIHSERGPLPHLFSNVITTLELDLFFRLKGLPRNTLLMVFSDHGFVENPSFDGGRQVRNRTLHPRRGKPLRGDRALGPGDANVGEMIGGVCEIREEDCVYEGATACSFFAPVVLASCTPVDLHEK